MYLKGDTMSDYRILVTGATGQIGSELTVTLREKYGKDNVIAMGHRRKPSKTLAESGPYITGDVRDRENLEKIIREYDIDTVYHMAAILSATAKTILNYAGTLT